MRAHALDDLVRRRAISGYTVERDAGYLDARRPTLTYRMYRDRRGAQHARRFIADMAALGALVTLTGTRGNLRGAGDVQRTAQMTVTARFDGEQALAGALALVRERYHARGRDPVPGSWWLPDVRIAGCGPLQGTMPALAQSVSLPRGTAVALTLSTRRLVPGARVGRVRVLGEWAELLR